VPLDAVIEALIGERLDLRNRLRREVRPELNDDLAVLELDHELVAVGACRRACEHAHH
jgi:hypothetical protein